VLEEFHSEDEQLKLLKKELEKFELKPTPYTSSKKRDVKGSIVFSTI